MIRLEHGNLTVRDVDAVVRFARTAFPEFRVRGEGLTDDGRRWLHLGTADYYLALDQAAPNAERLRRPYDGNEGLNHLGWVVDDADALRARLSEAGYRESMVDYTHHARKRVYFLDPEGNDWEFVEYLSDDPAERNAYG